MRKIIVSTFLSMDGVLQGPGGPHEDLSQKFKQGGWSANYWDDMMEHTIAKQMADPYDLLLGRRTYEIFAAHWPYQKNDPISAVFDRVQKYVVATTPVALSWQNSTLINGDVVNELKKLKNCDGPNLLVNGSGKLMQTLLKHNLVDVLHTWTFPVTLGAGKRLFEDGTQAAQWRLTNSSVSTTGVIMASYVPDGNVQLGSFVTEKISDAEIVRREKVSKE